jgi:predicted DNA-binding mobile mystery protein A
MNPGIRRVILEELERRLPVLAAARRSASVPARGWLRAVREGIGLTQSRAARNAAMKRQSLAQFEIAESKGSISLVSLRRTAEAMDCELVYFVVPREATASTYSALAERLNPVSGHLRATDQSMTLDGPPPTDNGG